MPVTALKVELLAMTPDAMTLIYAAFRQCYAKGFVGKDFKKWVKGEVPLEQQKQFIENILASGHQSPIEHVSFTFAVEGVSRALTHQLVRHRIASYSQQSQRYVDAKDFCYILPPAIAKNEEAKAIFEEFMTQAAETYAKLQAILEDSGRGKKANEDARYVLPNACESKIVFTMNCRSLLNFFELRCCNRAQWEIRNMAWKMLKLVREKLPVVFNLAGPKCERLGYCPEGEKFSCGKYPCKLG
ncbi:thymidylate synthase (FAD) [Desulfonauticus submarinus]|uniref:Flavin-dependent thymidylate synthase n=1 Tax=Desulfonauticus submarinus TaxID=206665 RepID=A0A1H0GHY2_9BACT|nr:FAD-dependent thymidylate synthase [Desulfonauticus submarinus]SDO06443.1 thymidylate synthase (FAD) [Desulfonauticus submarinus]